MIFGINTPYTTSDISKLLYVISQAVRRVKFETIFRNITSGIYAKYDVQIMLLFVYTTSRKRFVIFTCRHFKLSWNTTALSQSNCKNFSCSSIKNLINPLSPNSVQHQFSPNNIHTLSRDKVMRINKMITIEKIPWSFIKFSQLILKGDVWRSVWRICMWILGLKGLTTYLA